MENNLWKTESKAITIFDWICLLSIPVVVLLVVGFALAIKFHLL